MDILKRLSGFTDGISNADVYKLAHDEIALLRAKLSQPTPSQSDDEKDAYMARLETLIYRIRNHDKRCVQHEWVENVLASKPAQLSKPQPTSQDTAHAERWRHFACDQTALILGSKLSPSDTNVNWLEECNKLADAAMKEGK